MKGTPPWFSSPAIQDLLNRLVDRLDGAEGRGSARAQSVALTMATWPALFNQTYESDREALWEQARQLHQLGYISITPEAAAKSTSGYDVNPRIVVADVARVRAAAGRPQRSKSAGKLWREAVYAHLQAPDEAKDTVSSFCIELEGHSPECIVQRLNQLRDLLLRPAQIHPHRPSLFQDRKRGVFQPDQGGTRSLRNVGRKCYRSVSFLQGRSGSQGGSLPAWQRRSWMK